MDAGVSPISLAVRVVKAVWFGKSPILSRQEGTDQSSTKSFLSSPDGCGNVTEVAGVPRSISPSTIEVLKNGSSRQVGYCLTPRQPGSAKNTTPARVGTNGVKIFLNLHSLFEGRS